MQNVAIAKIDELQNSYWQTHNDHLILKLMENNRNICGNSIRMINYSIRKWVISSIILIDSIRKIHQFEIYKKKEVKEEEEKFKLYVTLLVAKSNPTPSKQTWSKPPSPVVQSWTGNSPPK